MLEALRSLDGHSCVGNRRIVLTPLVMENLSFEQQLEAMLTTDLLVGMHGAGLTFLVFLPSTSAMVEIQSVPTTLNNAHWQNETDTKFECMLDTATKTCQICESPYPSVGVFKTPASLLAVGLDDWQESIQSHCCKLQCRVVWADPCGVYLSTHALSFCPRFLCVSGRA